MLYNDGGNQFQFHKVQLKDNDGGNQGQSTAGFQFHKVQLKVNENAATKLMQESFNSIRYN